MRWHGNVPVPEDSTAIQGHCSCMYVELLLCRAFFVKWRHVALAGSLRTAPRRADKSMARNTSHGGGKCSQRGPARAAAHASRGLRQNAQKSAIQPAFSRREEYESKHTGGISNY